MKKAAVAFAATLIIWLPLLLALAAKPVPERREIPIEPPEAGEETSISFPIEQPSGDVRVHEAWLRVPDATAVMSLAEVHVAFKHSDHAFPHPVEGYLEVVGTPCRFEIATPAHVADRRPLRFVRNDRCRERGAPSGDLKLVMRLGGPGTMGIYVRALPEAHRTAASIYVSDVAGWPGGVWPAITGRFVTEAPDSPLRRANLLSYLWTTRTDAGPVWMATAAALLMMWAGLCCFPFTAADDFPQRSRFAARTGIGAGALAFSLAGVYGLITPPFQAADESHHFASFAHIHGRMPLVDQAKAWAAIGHFPRITGRQFERFRPEDVGRPDPVGPGFEIHSTIERSSLTVRLWQPLSRLLPDSARETFIIMRLLHAAIFALALGASAFLLAAFAPVAFPQLLSYVFLLVPALPFFGMHVGESAIVTSVAVAFAALVVLVVVDGIRFRGFGLLAGLFAMALIAAARHSLPLLPVIATLLLLRIGGLAGRRGEADSAARFWAGFAIGAATYAIVMTDAHLASLVEVVTPAADRLPGVGGLFRFAVSPWFVFVAAAFGYLLERGLRRPLASIAAVASRPLRAAAVAVPVTLIVLIAISFAGSLYWSYPIVESIQGEGRTTMRGYFVQVAATTLTTFRWTRPSMLLSSSFWTGFGWLDTMPPAQIIAVLTTLTGASLIGLLAHIASRRDVRLFVTLGVVALGCLVTLAGYIYSSYSILTNLHGRYLIGWNLIVLAVCWTWPALAAPRRSAARLRWPPRTVWMLVAAGLIHAYAARFVLQRYF